MVNHPIAVLGGAGDNESANLSVQRSALAERLQLPLINAKDAVYSNYEMVLRLSANGLSLQSTDKKVPVNIMVDFDAGAINYRVHDAANSQAIAKAVGVKPGLNLSILDGTAGFGKDAFLLASLGCKVTMLERNQIVHALLDDGLSRARQSHRSKTRHTIDRMQLEFQEFSSKVDYNEGSFDVVFLDPMFPQRRKSAKVKKEMIFLQKLLVNTQNKESDKTILQTAMKLAKRRVVVKRARHAGNFADQIPDYLLSGRTNRFDIYLRSTSPNQTV